MKYKPLPPGIFDAICSYENFYIAYKEAIRGKRYHEEMLRFTRDLEANLKALIESVRDGTYRVGEYRQFYVTVPKTRLVMALGFKDRIVQWAIYRQLNPYIDKRFIKDSYGCRVDKGTLRAFKQLEGWFRAISRKPDYKNWYYLKLDVSKFFYRVDHEIMLAMLRELTDDERFIHLMDIIINNPEVPFGLPEGITAHDCPPEDRLFDVGMPIGNLSSQMMANLYLDPLDKFIKHELGFEYSMRYMDDTIICSNDLERLHEAQRLIDEFLQNVLHLRLNQKSAIRRVSAGVEFVGYFITANGTRLRRSTTKRIKSVFRHFMKEYAEGHISFDRILETTHSYFGMFKHTNSAYMRKWIEENVVFVRKKQPEREPTGKWMCFCNPNPDLVTEWPNYFMDSYDDEEELAGAAS